MTVDIQDIINSVSVPGLIKDDFIKQSSFLRLNNGDLQAYVGGFSVVFPTERNGEKWAFRCWHHTLDDSISRLRILSEELNKYGLPYFVEFHYTNAGIVVNGTTYPTTRMKWIDGLTIKDYICNYYNNSTKLLNLANLFLKFVRDMHSHSLAHGDLQHGNILVGNDGKLYLVDYDSCYCPKLSKEKDIITGLKDYQHPSRKNNRFISEKIDYFSELIIYTSILGIAYNPQLCLKYQLEDSEHMLFESRDFSNLSNSQIYNDLKGLNPIFTPLLEILNIYLTKDNIQDLEPFDILLDKMTKAPEIVRFVSTPQNSLYEGDKINLSWIVKGASRLILNGREVKSSVAGRTLSAGDNLYTLKASNDFKETRKTIKVQALETPSIELFASEQKLKAHNNEEITINWHVANAKEVFLEYGSICEKVTSDGQKKFVPTENTEYKVRAIGKDGKREFYKSVSVYVYEEATVEFKADKDHIIAQLPVKLSWQIFNAKSAVLVGYNNVPLSGDKTINPDKSSEYILRVTDEFGTKDHKLHIDVWPEPTINFSSSKNKLNKDKKEKTKLRWEVLNCTSVLLDINGKASTVDKKGSIEIELKETSHIKLTAIGLDNQTEYKKDIIVSVFNQAKVSFCADRKYTLPEFPVKLSWNVEHARDLELKGYGKVDTVGSKSVKTKVETKYTLVVTDEFGTNEYEIEVKMLPLPTIKSINVPVPELNKHLNITVNVPTMEPHIEFPEIRIPIIDIEVPTNNKYDLSCLLDSVKTRDYTSLFGEIKSLFTHYYNKLSNGK